MEPGRRKELQELIVRLADGDRTAFGPTFALLRPLFEGFARKHLPPEEAEEVAQTALIKLFRRASTFDARRDAASFCLGIAAWEVRTCRQSRRRRAAREAPVDEAARIPGGGPSPEEAAIAADLEEELGLTAASLGPLDAATLAALIRGERPGGVDPVTFRKRVSRALARLKTIWRMSHGTE